jgi:hypothetical protein
MHSPVQNSNSCHMTLSGFCAGIVDKRRSGRLAGQPAVEYNENILLACDDNRRQHACAQRARFAGVFKVACSGTEIYEPVHVKALGTWGKPWKLFVDGYDRSTGKRVRVRRSCHLQVAHHPSTSLLITYCSSNIMRFGGRLPTIGSISPRPYVSCLTSLYDSSLSPMQLPRVRSSLATYCPYLGCSLDKGLVLFAIISIGQA